jgi:hypothetical protein
MFTVDQYYKLRQQAENREREKDISKIAAAAYAITAEKPTIRSKPKTFDLFLSAKNNTEIIREIHKRKRHPYDGPFKGKMTIAKIMEILSLPKNSSIIELSKKYKMNYYDIRGIIIKRSNFSFCAKRESRAELDIRIQKMFG